MRLRQLTFGLFAYSFLARCLSTLWGCIGVLADFVLDSLSSNWCTVVTLTLYVV